MVALVHKNKTNDMPEGFRNDKSLLAITFVFFLARISGLLSI